jgi:hypothetical protein
MKSVWIKAERVVVGAVVLFGATVAVAAAQSPVPITPADRFMTTEAAAHPKLVAEERNDSGPKGYSPDVSYRGRHDPNRIYRVELGLKMWRPNPKPEVLRNVTCGQAKRALEQDGTWYGRITRNGGCGSGDDTTWATGNYLNFLEQPHRSTMGL